MKGLRAREIRRGGLKGAVIWSMAGSRKPPTAYTQWWKNRWVYSCQELFLINPCAELEGNAQRVPLVVSDVFGHSLWRAMRLQRGETCSDILTFLFWLTFLEPSRCSMETT